MTSALLAVLLLAAPAPAATPTPAPAATPAAPHVLEVDDLNGLREVGDFDLSPDAHWVAYEVEGIEVEKDEAQSDLWMAPLPGGEPPLPAGEPVRLTSSPKSEKHPRFSPDGRFLAFLAKRDDKKTQVWLLDRRGGEAVKLTSYKASVSGLAWSPDSRRLALVVADVDPEDPELAEENDEKAQRPRPIVLRRRQFKRDGEGYLREFRDHLHVFDLATKQSVQVTSGAYDDSQPTWSPDGSLIAFVSNRTPDPDSNQNSDVFVVAPQAGQAPRALTRWAGADSAPRFSPDGRVVAYVRGGDPKDMWYGPTSVGLVGADGSGERSLTAELDRSVEQPRFTPDGQALLFLLEDGGNKHLARVALAGGPVQRVLAGERDVQRLAVGRYGALVVRESQPWQPAELALVTPEGPRRLTRTNDAWLQALKLGRVERHRATSRDGTPIDVFVTFPPDYQAGQRRPAVLRIHGGPVDQYAWSFDLEWQVLAAAGYVVVAANPRGSSGRGLAFSRAIWADWGNKDFDDVMAAVDLAVERGWVDPARLGVGGWSYGGILTDYVVTKTTRFKAAVSGASEANYFANYGTDHYQYEWETELGLPWRNVELWQKLSPWFHVENVKTPTLVMCGQEDWNVPLLNSEQLYQALKRLGVETELVVYPGEDHSIGRPSFRRDRYQRYLDWYGRHLK